MAEPSIRLEGDIELKKIMKEVGSLRPVKKALGQGAVHLKGKVAEYPTQLPPVNPKYRYIRGAGTRYVPTGKTQLTSERHGQSWTVQSRAGGLTWVVGSDTTYGRYLQYAGPDKPRQTLRHKRANWDTTQDVADREAKGVVSGVKRAIDIELAKGHA